MARVKRSPMTSLSNWAKLSRMFSVSRPVLVVVLKDCRNVKRGRDAATALRWTAAAMLEAAKGFRRLQASSQLPQLHAALLAHQQKAQAAAAIAQAQQAT